LLLLAVLFHCDFCGCVYKHPLIVSNFDHFQSRVSWRGAAFCDFLRT